MDINMAPSQTSDINMSPVAAETTDINMVNISSCGSPDHGPVHGVQIMLFLVCVTSGDYVDMCGLSCCQRPCWSLWSMLEHEGILIISGPCHHQYKGPCWCPWALLDKWYFNVISALKGLREKDTIFEKVSRWDYLRYSVEVVRNRMKKAMEHGGCGPRGIGVCFPWSDAWKLIN